MSNLEENAWLKQLFDHEGIYIFPSESTNTEASETVVERPLSFEGSFENKILVIIEQESSQSFSNGPLYVLLQKILAAVKCNIEQTALLNLAENPGFDIGEILAELQPKKALLFLPKSQIEQSTLSTERYQSSTFSATGTQLLSSDTLEEVSKNQEIKKKLWVSLQTLF